MMRFFDQLKWPWEESEIDDRVYQRENGTMYIKSGEFARSEEGQKLLKRFTEHIETEDE